MNRRPRSYGSRQLSGKKARAALSLLLSGCRAEQLAGFTAEGLAASWNVALPEVEAMLERARKARAA